MDASLRRRHLRQLLMAFLAPSCMSEVQFAIVVRQRQSSNYARPRSCAAYPHSSANFGFA